MKHNHGWAYQLPRTKSEWLLHLTREHGVSDPDIYRRTASALAEQHDALHQPKRKEEADAPK